MQTAVIAVQLDRLLSSASWPAGRYSRRAARRCQSRSGRTRGSTSPRDPNPVSELRSE